MFPRYSKLTTTILSWMKNEGVKIILFTSQNYSAVQGYGDIILPCAISSLSYKNHKKNIRSDQDGRANVFSYKRVPPVAASI